MGNNCVAVLMNDFSGEIEHDGPLGKRMAHAMNVSWPKDDGYFRVGRIISRANASDWQVAAIHGNTGWAVDDLGQQHAEMENFGNALQTMKACLERHGYTVVKRRKPKTETAA